MGFLVAGFGGLLLWAAFGDDLTSLDKPLQYAAVGVGTVLVLAGLFAHYRWGGGDDG